MAGEPAARTAGAAAPGKLPPTIGFRPAVADDAHAMFAVHLASVLTLCRDAYSATQLQAWFHGRSPAIYEAALSAGEVELACDGDQVVGFAGAVPGELTLLFVDPRYTGCGLGRALCERALLRASRGWQGALVVLATRNATAFYARYGFEPVDELALERGEPLTRIEVVRMRRLAQPASSTAADPHVTEDLPTAGPWDSVATHRPPPAAPTPC